MAVMDEPCLFPCFFFISFVSVIASCSSQSYLPQNFEAFYPFAIENPSSAEAPSSINHHPLLNSTLSSPALPKQPSTQGGLSETKKNVIKAVAVTAATTFIAATFFFFLIKRYIIVPRRRKLANRSGGGGGAAHPDQFARRDRNKKGLAVDENVLDVLYWKQVQEEHRNVFRGGGQSGKMAEMKNEHMKSEFLQETPLLQGGSSASHKVVPERDMPAGLLSQPSYPPHSPPSASSSMAIPGKQGPAAPSPSRAISVENAIPNASTNKQVPAPPPIPKVPAKKNHPPAPPPPKAGAGKLPALQKGIRDSTGGDNSSTGEDKRGAGNGQVKMKPLHWDKLSKDFDHSMVWDRIDGGSFKFDDDLMEALFGYVAANRRSHEGDRSSDLRNVGPGPPPQITILDARKSQNAAIVLKSLAISREQILDAISEGRNLDVDVLEKLTRTAPTIEEQSKILGYRGDPSRLADAESFFYHLLKAIPSAIHRLSAMLFRLNYDAEIANFKKCLQTLEGGCEELRNRGLFIKLLEAVLKAGNRMNVGTPRGNAQAFKLSSLSKLSDVKSTDGKTTLLHFVVEEVVRSEGKRCVLSRSRSFNRSNSIIYENSESKQEREMEYMKLGLPVVGGLSSELSNVKKATQIDYSSFASTCSALTTRVTEIRSLVSECAGNGEGGFVREMRSFLTAAEEEIGTLRKEQLRIMELVKKTTEYYQAGGGMGEEAQALQLFAITKDFLGMVDQVCIEIARKLQKKRTASSSSGSSQKSS